MPRPVTYTIRTENDETDSTPPSLQTPRSVTPPPTVPQVPGQGSPRSNLMEKKAPQRSIQTEKNNDSESVHSEDSAPLREKTAAEHIKTETEAWVRLARADLSARRLHRLLDHFGDPDEVLGASARVLRDLGLNDTVVERLLTSANAPLKSELSYIESQEIAVLPYTHPHYPASLNEIYDPPVVIFVRGNLNPADEYAVAIVGSRRASPYGRSVSERLAKELAEAGFTVVSGLARGIDTAAHQGVLSVGGPTIGVLGCGVDVAYPASNRSLIARMAKEGAVLSEFAPGTQPDAWRFPARNRIISGLSKGVIVIESPESSGSLITVDYALEQGREVFAVPGSIETGLNSGCHKLLKEGAILVESVKDVLQSFGMADLKPRSKDEPAPELSPVETRLLEKIGFEQKLMDDLIEETVLPPAQVNAALMTLELNGLVRKLPGGFYTRTSLVFEK